VTIYNTVSLLHLKLYTYRHIKATEALGDRIPPWRQLLIPKNSHNCSYPAVVKNFDL